MKKALILPLLFVFLILVKAEGQVNEIQNNTTSVTIMPGSISSTHISNNTSSNNKDNLVLGKNALEGFLTSTPANSASENVVIGHNAMNRGHDALSNVAIGANAGYWSVYSDRNVAIGTNALHTNSPNSGLGNNNDDNVAIGHEALKNLYSYNSRNVGIGTQSLFNTSNKSVGIGFGSGYGGIENSVVLGYGAGYTGGFYNGVFIGYQAGYSETNPNRLYIENSNSSTPLIGGDFDNNIVSINRPISSLSSTPNDKLQVGGGTTIYGNLTLKGSRISTVIDILSDFTITDSHYLIIYSGPGGHTITLPSALPYLAYEFKIVNQGGGAISTNMPYKTGLSTITQTIPASSAIHIISDGTNWRKIN